MVKTVSATQAKNHFGSLVESITKCGDEVIVENRGEEQIAMLPVSEYRELAKLRDQKRRSDALARLYELREEVSARNADLTEDEAKALVKEMVDDAIASLFAKGKLRYKE